MPDPKPAPDPAALAAQVEQLQSRVDALEDAGENAIEGLVARTDLSRRRVLQGLAAAGVSVAALGAATEEAEAQAVGQVGTDSDRVDVFAESVEVGEGTIDGKQMPGIPATSSDPGLSIGDWRQVSATRAAFVLVSAQAVTDGSSTGEVDVAVDESGGTSEDYRGVVSRAPSELGAGVEQFDSLLILLPPGAQFRYENISDPNNANSIQRTREFVL